MKSYLQYFLIITGILFIFIQKEYDGKSPTKVSVSITSSVKEDVIPEIRSKYLLSFTNAFPVFWNSVNSFKLRQSFFKDLQAQGYLQAVFITDSVGNLIYRSEKSNKKPSLNFLSLKKYPTILNVSNEKDTRQIVSKIDNNYLIVIFSTKVDTKESIVLQKLQKANSNDENWQKINEIEELSGVRILSDLITKMIAFQMKKDKSFKISEYLKFSKAQISYILLHGKGGKILKNSSFHKDLAEFDESLWEKSSVTAAYLYQHVKYENKDILDVCNPIYDNNQWVGAIRMGFYRLHQERK